MLSIDKLTKKFGGLCAVQDVSFDVSPNQIYSVIGPNGAGKTTLFNIISGIYTPTQGVIRLFNKDVSASAPNQLAAMGMSRTFQNLQVGMNMSAIENVMIGAHLQLDHSFVSAILRMPSLARTDRSCLEKCAELMEFVGVGQYIKSHASAMSYGALKRLEIARALAADPKLLLLDEPAAGLNHTETHEIAGLVKKIAEAGGTVLLVEHDMKMVMDISDRILVLDYGKKLAEGTAQEVRANPDVIAAYLGAAA